MSTDENVTFICAHFEIPGEYECREVIWSEGKSCRKCPLHECYRNGWHKNQVDKDNKRLFGRKAAKQ
jgi:hypothetical protein